MFDTCDRVNILGTIADKTSDGLRMGIVSRNHREFQRIDDTIAAQDIRYDMGVCTLSGIILVVNWPSVGFTLVDSNILSRFGYCSRQYGQVERMDDTIAT